MADLNKGKGKQSSPVNLHLHYHYDSAENRAAGPAAPVSPHQDEAEAMVDAQMDKAIAATTGNPYGEDYGAMRVSEPLAAGRAASSTGDHGVGQGRNADLAVGITGRDIKQGRTQSYRQESLSTVNGEATTDPSRDITYTPGRVNVQRLDLAGAAGRFGGMQPVNPSLNRPGYHQHRDSATPDNGSHDLGTPQSTYVSSMKSESRLDLMKALQRRMD